MPKFTYKAKKGPGDLIEGTVEAENLNSAIEKIMKLGLSPLDVVADIPQSQQPTKTSSSISFPFYRRIGSSDIVRLTRQLCDLIDAGVPMLRSLQVVSRQTKNLYLRKIIEQMHVFVRDGGSFSEALAQHPNIFSSFYINMVKTGEMSGNLDDILSRLSEFLEKDLETQSKVKSSLIYPVFMLLVGAATIFVILSFVIPRLSVIFEDLASSLPLPTVILLGVGDFFSRFWWFIVILLGIAGLYYRQFKSSREGKYKIDAFKLKLPFLGSFIKNVEIGRFSRTLGTLLESGVVIVSALESVWAVLDNEVLKKEIRGVIEDVASGTSLSEALGKSVFFPEVAINMIAVGEESGHLERSLVKLAFSFERESERTIKTVTSLLEPALIFVIGSIIGFMFMAILLPIFKINLMVK